ncbi:hypothetical protein [Nocardia sp. BMG51109]|uniref:SCO6745 family protein n=1 Tax=Nocardia sp. BMG51109 TaxID=1056816 RepID=UPI0004648B9B|nr:hypothetical protein [Nocardia sp. BMG51109]
MSVAAAVKQQIQEIGGGFMFSRETKAFGDATGVAGFLGPYTRGRGGVLGDVDADVVTAAFGFFRPETVRAAWESVPMPPGDAAAAYLAACQGFGRRKLAGFDEAGRLAELLRSVVAAADVAGLPLFAGWRALPLADDDAARALQLIHVVRELRGGLHLLAIRAGGVTPRQAVLIGGSPRNSGPDQARLFGWPEPFEEITAALRQRWDAAEALTDRLIAPAFAGLDERSGDELVRLLDQAHKVVFGGR